MDPALQTLLQHPAIWRAKAGAVSAPPTLPSGFTALDSALRGGWPSGALTELLLTHTGVGELGLLMPLLKHRSGALPPTQQAGPTDRVGPTYHVWIDPPLLPYAPTLLQHGVKLDNLLIVYPADRAQWLWTCVQALRSGSASAVLCWPNKHRLRYADIRQLQVAANEHGSVGFLLRDLTHDASLLHHSSAAPLRLHLRPLHGALNIEVLKQRGHAVGQQITLLHDAALQAQTPLRKRTVVTNKTPALRTPQPTASVILPEARWL